MQELTSRHTNEHINGLPERDWGYRHPTVLIESQSAPALKGHPAEQVYMRSFPLTSPKDLVVTDFALNRCYLDNYLSETLGFNLPKFIVVPNSGANCLSENLIVDQESLKAIQIWSSEWKGVAKIQFFNITDSEKRLAEKLGIKASCGDIDKTIGIGSKTGFRRLCEKLGVPMPEGYVCEDEYSTQQAVAKLFTDGKSVLIKSENGTGGTELKSNVLLTWDEWKKSNLSLRDYVSEKLKFFNPVLGDEWVVEEVIQGEDGSVHVYIHDEENADPSFILGALSQNNSYVGGYWPFEGNSESERMEGIVDQILAPTLQKLGVFGYHCFDFKDGKFLEDNPRQGALDFIDGIVARTAAIHFHGQNYAYWHCHVPISQPTTFDDVWDKLRRFLTPHDELNHSFGIVTNPEVLLFGRSLDLTSVSFGQGSSLETARNYFRKLEGVVKSVL